MSLKEAITELCQTVNRLHNDYHELIAEHYVLEQRTQTEKNHYQNQLKEHQHEINLLKEDLKTSKTNCEEQTKRINELIDQNRKLVEAVQNRHREEFK